MKCQTDLYFILSIQDINIFFELNIHNRTLYVCECLKLNPPAKPLNTEKCIYESCFTFKRICIPFHPDPRLTPLYTALPGNRGNLCGVCFFFFLVICYSSVSLKGLFPPSPTLCLASKRRSSRLLSSSSVTLSSPPVRST